MKFKWLYLITLFVWIGKDVYAQSYTETQKAVPSDRNKVDKFGLAVALYGSYAAIAAPLQDDSSKNPVLREIGSVYVFEKDSLGNWKEIQKLSPSDQVQQDEFGHSVSLWDSTLMIGAPFQNLDDTSGNSKGNAGAVYCYVLSDSGQWNLAQKIVADDRRAGQNFGWDVALKGKRMMVSALRDNWDANRRNNLLAAGSAYFFEQDSSGRWVQSQKISASDRKANARFGFAVDFSGNYAVVGAPWETADTTGSTLLTKAGAAYFYSLDKSNRWIEQQKITASDRDIGNEFGYKVCIDNKHSLISSPFKYVSGVRNGTVYIMSFDNFQWIENKTISPIDGANSSNDNFGISLDLNQDRFVIGLLSDLDSNGNRINGSRVYRAGAVEIYSKDSTGWNYSHTRVASDQAEGDYFGVAVAMHRNMVLVGAPQEDHDTAGRNFLLDAGSAYFFEANCVMNAATDVQFACDSFAWNNGQVFYASDSSAQDTLLNYYGCDSVATLQLTVGSNDSTVVQRGDTLTALQTGASYQWLNCDSNYRAIAGATAQTFVAPLNGNYAVEISNGFCTKVSDCIYVSITQLEEIETSLKLSIAPNPFKESLEWQWEGAEALHIAIYNLQAQLVYEALQNLGKQQINSAAWPKGLYILRFQSKETRGAVRLVKQ